jgi:AraC family transcriptional regulator of adaptative response/methylated-DNA-[protein]-cysteine methyltransferase
MHATDMVSSTDTNPTTIQYRISHCSLGAVAIAATAQGVCAILFGDDAAALENDLNARFPASRLTPGDAAFDGLADQAIRFIDDPEGSVDFPLDPHGTDFQQHVWQALREIAPGTTASYKEIAMRIGAPKAVRAIARACATNPIAIAIPCHRVVRSDGSMSGYRWGTARKRTLLDREERS